MGRPIKKLQKSDINKNSSSQVSHTIRKIKENEAKYTAVLVLVFMALFCVIGFFTLRVNNGFLTDSVHQLDVADYGLSLSSSVVTLSASNVMSEEEGLQSNPYYLTVENRTMHDMNYKIVLVEDEDLYESCGCQSIPLNQIHFSFEEEHSTILDESHTIGEAFLMSGKKKQYKVRIWLDSSYDSFLEAHFHGHFVIERQ